MTDFQQLARSINVIIQSDWAVSCDETALAQALEEDGATESSYPIPTENGMTRKDKKRFPKSCAVIALAD